mgnify:CR=1 FL=1
MEQNTMRRVDDNTVVLDGLIWSTNTEKMINIKNTDNNSKIFSIKIEDTHYYPIGFDKNNRKKNYVQIIDKEK